MLAAMSIHQQGFITYIQSFFRSPFTTSISFGSFLFWSSQCYWKYYEQVLKLPKNNFWLGIKMTFMDQEAINGKAAWPWYNHIKGVIVPTLLTLSGCNLKNMRGGIQQISPTFI